MPNHTPHMPPLSPAILLMGHGTQDPEGVQEFKVFAQQFAQQLPQRLVKSAFLEFVTPTMDQCVEEIARLDIKHITVLPIMLTAAGHTKNDIPSEIHNLEHHQPQLRFVYGRDLNLHPAMLRAAQERIMEAEQLFQPAYRREDTLLIVVGRGTSDPDANSNISKLTRMLWEGMGFGWAETCYSGVTLPRLEPTLKLAAGLGFKNLLVFPYFLFTGRLVKRIYQQTLAFAQDYPKLRIHCVPYLNHHPLVLKTALERLHEAEHGQANMNCQLCKYREPIIGFENQVGESQRGHHFHVRGHHSHAHSDEIP